ncbi:MAG: ABC transporter permease [Bacilli bacterium]|jgi:fluoroquinolone transport system permease protein
MKKYCRLFVYEIKTILRDPMNVFLLVYPLFMLILIGWLLPLGLNRGGLNNSDIAYSLTMIIIFVVVISIGGYVSGSLLGFSLLENKDEKTIKSIAVTPVSLTGYIIFKTIYSYIFSFAGNLFLILGIKWLANDAYSFSFGSASFGFDNLDYIHIIAFSLVSSLIVPAVGTLIASIAKNKIEGFAFMKSGGILVMIPALVLIDAMSDWKQYLLGIAPNFWPVKALLNEALNSQGSYDLPFWAYLLIGGIIMLSLAIVSIVAFLRKQAHGE